MIRINFRQNKHHATLRSGGMVIYDQSGCVVNMCGCFSSRERIVIIIVKYRKRTTRFMKNASKHIDLSSRKQSSAMGDSCRYLHVRFRSCLGIHSQQSYQKGGSSFIKLKTFQFLSSRCILKKLQNTALNQIYWCVKNVFIHRRKTLLAKLYLIS